MTRLWRSAITLAISAACFCPIFTLSASETVNYEYDALGRLVKVARTGSANDGISACYNYDRSSNRTKVKATTSDCEVVTEIVLYPGQSLWSDDGRFRLTMQVDGNLVLYGPAGQMWASGTSGGADRRMVMQLDGKLVVYNGANQALWQTNTAGNPGSSLSLQTDGNLVIRSAANVVLWQTGTVYVPPSFSVGDTNSIEGAPLTFLITRSGVTAVPHTVFLETVPNTAYANVDFTPYNGSLTFAANETSKTLSVASINDARVESAEKLFLRLTSISNGAVIGDGEGAGLIDDNDQTLPAFFVSNTTSAEGEGLTFTVHKSGTVSGSYSVNFLTGPNTATSPSDYTHQAGTLTFAATESSKTVTVATANDTTVESDETLFLNLESPSGGATIADAQGVGTIIDNDSSVASISVNNASTIEGGLINFVLTRSGFLASSVSVFVATANNTAGATSDYNAFSGTITFAPNETTKPVNIATVDTSFVESTETMFLNLSSPTGGAVISDNQGVGTIIDNDEDDGGGGGCPPSGCPIAPPSSPEQSVEPQTDPDAPGGGA